MADGGGGEGQTDLSSVLGWTLPLAAAALSVNRPRAGQALNQTLIPLMQMQALEDERGARREERTLTREQQAQTEARHARTEERQAQKDALAEAKERRRAAISGQLSQLRAYAPDLPPLESRAALQAIAPGAETEQQLRALEEAEKPIKEREAQFRAASALVGEPTAELPPAPTDVPDVQTRGLLERAPDLPRLSLGAEPFAPAPMPPMPRLSEQQLGQLRTLQSLGRVPTAEDALIAGVAPERVPGGPQAQLARQKATREAEFAGLPELPLEPKLVTEIARSVPAGKNPARVMAEARAGDPVAVETVRQAAATVQANERPPLTTEAIVAQRLGIDPTKPLSVADATRLNERLQQQKVEQVAAGRMLMPPPEKAVEHINSGITVRKAINTINDVLSRRTDLVGPASGTWGTWVSQPFVGTDPDENALHASLRTIRDTEIAVVSGQQTSKQEIERAIGTFQARLPIAQQPVGPFKAKLDVLANKIDAGLAFYNQAYRNTALGDMSAFINTEKGKLLLESSPQPRRGSPSGRDLLLGPR